MELNNLPISYQGKGLLIEGCFWTERVYIVEAGNEAYLIADDLIEIDKVNGKYSSAYYGKRLNKSLWFTLKQTCFSERYQKPQGVDQTHGMAIKTIRELDEILKPETMWGTFKDWLSRQVKGTRLA